MCLCVHSPMVSQTLKSAGCLQAVNSSGYFNIIKGTSIDMQRGDLEWSLSCVSTDLHCHLTSAQYSDHYQQK